MKSVTSILLLALSCFFFQSLTAADPGPVHQSTDLPIYQFTTTPPRVLFILDGSGSMWQKLDGDFKITTAKTVMKNLLDKLPDEAGAGLIAYGHNRKSDCEDIETLVSLAPLDRAAFTAKLDAINPQGKTPIAKSLNHALAILRSETEPVTVVLVTDGLETCDGDACELVQQAKAQGVKITLHVVGFGIEEEDLSSMECLAQAGGGQYFPANNAEELTLALDQTVEEPPADGGYLSVETTLEGELLDCIVKVFKKGETKEMTAARTYTAATTNPRVLLLPAGEYELSVEAVRIDGRPVQTLTELKIAGPDTLFKTVDFAQGTFEILVTRNGELSDATINIYQPGTKKQVAGGRSYGSASSNPKTFNILPGEYDIEIGSVEISGKPIQRWESQVLAGGKTISLAHEFKSGELKVGAKQGDAFVDAGVNIVSKTTGKSVAAGRTYMSDSSNPKTFTVEPGIYQVEIKPLKPKGLATKNIEVEVKAGETVERMAEF